MNGSNKRFSYDEPLSLEAFMKLADQELSAEAVHEMVELIRWFRRRYPTAKERFAYVTRKMRALRKASSSRS